MKTYKQWQKSINIKACNDYAVICEADFLAIQHDAIEHALTEVERSIRKWNKKVKKI